MRPIKLEIEGLQSFKEKQIIDFERLTELGLFGIFGETGSGKSTVLDAIIFAIYGEIIRNKDDGQKGNILSSINDSSKIMKVSFSFALGSDIYQIIRSYRRGTTKGIEVAIPKEVCFIKNENILGDKIKDVEKIILEEFGLKIEDFIRTVVLPQGKFSEFLKLKGKEKTEMLENIFDLKKYGEKLQEKVSSEKKYWFGEVEKYKNQRIGKGETNSLEIEELMKNLTIIEDEEKQKIEERKKIELDYENSKKLKELLDNKKKLEKEKIELELDSKEMETLNIKINKNDEAKIFKKDIEEMENLEIKHKNLLESKIEIEGEKKDFSANISEKEEERNKIICEKEKILLEKSKISFDKGKLRKLNALKMKKIAYKILLENINNLEENKKKIKLEIDLSEENKRRLIKEKKENIENINKIGEIDKFQIEKNNNLEKELKNQISELALKEEKIKKLELDLELIEKELATLFDKKSLISNNINKKEKENKKYLSYILAKDLTEGEPCPVCGSLHHIKVNFDSNINFENLEKNIKKLKSENEKYIMEEGKLTITRSKIEEELLDIKKELKNNSLEDLKEKLNMNKIKWAEEKELIDEKEKKLIELNNNQIKLNLNCENTEKEFLKNKNKLEELQKELEKKVIEKNKIELEILKLDKNYLFITNEELEKEIKKYEEDEDLIDKLQKKIEILSEKILSEEKEIKDIQDNMIEIDRKYIGIKTEEKLIGEQFRLKEIRLKNQIEKSVFNSIEEVKENIISEIEYKKIKFEVEKYKENLKKIETLIEENFKKINGKNIEDEEFEKIQNEYENIKKYCEIIKIEMSNLKKDIEDKKNKLKEIEEILLKEKEAERKYGVAEELFKKIKGKAFVQFLSVKKLQSIVHNASRRLVKITNGRYKLISNSECDFYVVDSFNNGYQRRCSTLSGGETFVVSLCLALALSNQLQLKGKTQLEFFFLDEGFGTLDEKLLDKVISSLELLREEEKIKIGIITHLEELKIRIIKKLEISPAIPGERGSVIKIV